jgi:hypothetical protein
MSFDQLNCAERPMTSSRLLVLPKLICVLMTFGLSSVAFGDCGGPGVGGGCSDNNWPRSTGGLCDNGFYPAPDGDGCVPSGHQYCGSGRYCINVGDVCSTGGGCTSRQLCSSEISSVRATGSLGLQIAEPMCSPFPDLLRRLRQAAIDHDQPPARIPVPMSPTASEAQSHVPAPVPVRKAPGGAAANNNCVTVERISATHCDNNDSLTAQAVNNCDKAVRLNLCLKSRTGSQNCLGWQTVPAGGLSESVFVCAPTGQSALQLSSAPAPVPVRR